MLKNDKGTNRASPGINSRIMYRVKRFIILKLAKLDTRLAKPPSLSVNEFDLTPNAQVAITSRVNFPKNSFISNL